MALENIADRWDSLRDIIGMVADTSGVLLAVHLDNLMSYGIGAVVAIHIMVNVIAALIRRRKSGKSAPQHHIATPVYTNHKPGPDPFRNRGLHITD